MSRPYREPCGCRTDATRWLEMCGPHAAEFNERHQRAQAEKDEREKAPPAYVIENPQLTLTKRGRELLEQFDGPVELVDELPPQVTQ